MSFVASVLGEKSGAINMCGTNRFRFNGWLGKELRISNLHFYTINSKASESK